MDRQPFSASPASSPTWLYSGPAAVHHPVLGLLVGTIGMEGIRTALGIAWPSYLSWLPMAVWTLAATSLLVGLARRLPSQNLVAVSVVAAGITIGVDTLDALTGIPFGRRHFGGGAGYCPAQTPILMVPLWVSLLLMSRGVARLILKRYRHLNYYGFWVLGLAAVLVVGEVTWVESVAGHLDWWHWIDPVGWLWCGAPMAGGVGWLATALLTLAFVTPWLLNKRPVKQPVDGHPLVIWFLTSAWLGSYQWAFGTWKALVVNACLNAAVSVSVWHGTRKNGAIAASAAPDPVYPGRKIIGG